MEKKITNRRALTTKTVVVAGLLTALSVILTRFFSIMLPIAGMPALRITFGSIPVFISGVVLGPTAGLLTGAIADLIGCLINPMGVYFVGFTISSALGGAIPGLIYLIIKKDKVHVNFNIINTIFILALSIGFTGTLFYKDILKIQNNTLMYNNSKLPMGIIISFIAIILVFILIPIVFNVKYKDRDNLYSLDKLLFCVTVNYFIIGIFLNTLWLSIMFNKAFMIFLPGRVLSGTIMVPIRALIIFALSKFFKYAE